MPPEKFWELPPIDREKIIAKLGSTQNKINEPILFELEDNEKIKESSEEMNNSEKKEKAA